MFAIRLDWTLFLYRLGHSFKGRPLPQFLFHLSFVYCFAALHHSISVYFSGLRSAVVFLLFVASCSSISVQHVFVISHAEETEIQFRVSKCQTV